MWGGVGWGGVGGTGTVVPAWEPLVMRVDFDDSDLHLGHGLGYVNLERCLTSFRLNYMVVQCK